MTKLSIIMPIACSDVQLNSIVSRLFQENAKFFQEVPSELILVDSTPNPRNTDSLNVLKSLSAQHGIALNYFETAVVGVGAKFDVGLRVSKGDYVFFMVDELLSLYGFLADAFDIAERYDVCSVPYLEARNPEGSTFPLLYPKHAAVVPVSFPLMRKALFVELINEMKLHWFGTLHWSVLCAELGLKVAFSSRHLVYCPLIKIDAVRPSIYQSIGRDVRAKDEQQFKDRWSFDECEQAHFSMVRMFKSVLHELRNDAHVVIGPKKGLFLVQETGGISLKNNYTKIYSDVEIDRESDYQLTVWKKNIEKDPKVAPLFLLKETLSVKTGTKLKDKFFGYLRRIGVK